LGTQPIQVTGKNPGPGDLISSGVGGALLLTRFLSSLLYDVSAHDPLTFSGVAALLMLVALAASYIPARRAMKVDPIVALRYE